MNTIRRTAHWEREPSQRPYTPQLSRKRAISLPAQPIDEAGANGFPAYWTVARRHKLLLIGLGVLGALAGYAIAKASSPVYRARITLEVMNFNDNFLNMRETSPTASGSGAGNDYDVHSQAILLQTSELRQQTARTLATMRASLHLSPLEIEKRVTDLRVHDSERTRIIDATLDSTDPQLAADYLNTLAAAFIEERVESRLKASSSTAQFLSGELDGLKSKLEQSESRLQNYATESGLMFAGKDNVAEEKLRQVQEQLSAAQAEVAQRRARFEMAARSPADALPEVRDNATIREYQAKLAELRRQFAELSASYTPAHYKVRRTQAEIDELELALQNERARIVERIGNEYQGALRRESLLSDNYGQQAALVSHLSGKAIYYDILKGEVDSNRKLYESMLARVKEATIASALRASNVRIADAAQRPLIPYKPRPMESTGLGMLAGVFAGWLFLFIRHRSDPKIHEPREAASYLQLPELGVVISAGTEIARPSGRMEPGYAGLLKDDNGNRPTALACLHPKESLLAECFRTILTSLMMAEPDCRVIVVASANSGEGKTTIVSNLGLMLATMNKRVLLIDADVRRPSLHRIFGRENSSGLTDLLAETTCLPHATEGYAGLETAVPGVCVLPAGSTNADAGLLYSQNLLELMKKFRAEFDMVLIDSPPMMHIPDARILGSVADGVILVCRANRTSREAALVATERFAQDGIPVVGTVLNDWNPGNSPYGYYKPNGYYGNRRTGAGA